MNLEEYPELQTNNPEVLQTPAILLEEIEWEIKSLANEKSPGNDGIPGELLKAGGKTMAKWIHRICQAILNGADIPNDWKETTIIPIHKKGDATKCENYRPIDFLPHAYKVLAKILQKRINRIEEEILNEEQAGFRRGRGTIDHVFTLGKIVEKT